MDADHIRIPLFDVAAHLIGTWGFGCVHAPNGADALVLAHSYRPDVILTDALMPRMDGWEALPLIKRVSPGTHVVVISALGVNSVLNDRAVWLGAATYLDKLEIMSMPEVVAAACTHN